jgi:hypothetical protein
MVAHLQSKDSEKCVLCFYKAIQLINLRRRRTYINKAIVTSYFSKEGL